ncbi:MAG: hypothetical protein E7311_01945 [Clostridiales bacterium]|nr:hypothetical protein [Clostridiales bacterium]
MANNPKYRFSRGEDGYIIFDSKGYIVEAKGFSSLMWSSNLKIDEELVGKHVDELAEMLKKNGKSRDEYFRFEAYVHVELLKEMLKNANG